MNIRNDYLGRVQVLRFFASFGVLFAHVQDEVGLRLMPGHDFPKFVLINGGFGVDVFFLISGFIMLHVSGSEFAKPGAPRDFIVRRFSRVAPLYYVATLLLLAVIMLAGSHVDSGEVTFGQITSSFLFLPYANSAGSINPVLKLGWTLNYEMYFYVVFAVSLFFVRKTSIMLMISFMASVIVLAQFLPNQYTILKFWGDPIVLEFVAGMGIAFMHGRGIRLPLLQAWGLVVGGLALVATFRAFGVFPYVPRAIYSGLPATLIVAGVVFGSMGQGRGRVMRLLELGGDASFALYLFHPFAIRGATVAWGILDAPKIPQLFIGVVILVAVVMSVLINIFIEKPINRLIRRRLHAPSVASVEDATVEEMTKA